MGYEVLAVLAIAGIAQAVKSYVYPKFGAIGVHVFAFALALIGVGVWEAAQVNPSVMDALLRAGTLLVSAVGVYEVILKRIGFSTGESLSQE